MSEVSFVLQLAEEASGLGDERGRVVVFPSNGDLPVLNIGDRHPEIAVFLEAYGAQRAVRQIEIVRSL